MRKFARIENEKVVEVFDLDAHHPDAPGIDGLFHPSIRWVPCSPKTKEGDVLVNGAVVSQTHYAVLRAAAYPPYQDFIDGMVKVHSPDPVVSAEGDAQVQAYCDACLAVKAAIPKV